MYPVNLGAAIAVRSPRALPVSVLIARARASQLASKVPIGHGMFRARIPVTRGTPVLQLPPTPTGMPVLPPAITSVSPVSAGGTPVSLVPSPPVSAEGETPSGEPATSKAPVVALAAVAAVLFFTKSKRRK